MTGSHLVAQVIDVQPNTSVSTSERGIVGLLNTSGTMSCLGLIQFSRDSETSLLSPAKSQRYTYR